VSVAPERRTSRRLPLLLAGLAALVAVALAVGGTLAIRSTTATASGSVTTATGWNLPAMTGSGRVALASFHGRPTVVTLFASWCSICDSELPEFATAARDLDGKVQFVGVASLETGDPTQMARRDGIEGWPLARDVGGAQYSGLHDALTGVGQGMPVTAFYDRSGRLLLVHRGAMSGAQLRATISHSYSLR
jgi:thiol-disulfide isomerase/thioredoxin